MRMTKRAWSVELESNAWQDDTFNGTVNECIRYCQERNITIDGINARLAEVAKSKNDEFYTPIICYQAYYEVYRAKFRYMVPV